MSDEERLNLVVLLCDQQQRDVLGPYGGAVPTPTWDRLAETGVVFDRFYCATPLCVPTRPSMMTGKWPHAHGAISFGKGYDTITPGQDLLIDRLHDAGYHVGYEGIWHINRTPEDSRSDAYAHFLASGFPYKEHKEMLAAQGGRPGEERAAVRTRTDGGHVDWSFSVPVPAVWTRPLDEHPDMVRARHIAEFILQAPADKPVAAWCSLGGPHPPLLVPEPYMSLFDPADMTPPPGFGEDMEGMPLAVTQSPGAQSVRDWTWDRWAVAIAAYWGYTAFVDACFDVVVDALERSGRNENTILIATGDHGEMLGGHNLYQKGVAYDRATRLAFVIRAPGLEPGRRGQLANHVDFAPTILDLLGEAPLAEAQGTSLAPILRDASLPGPEHTFVEFNGYLSGGAHARIAVSQRYKYAYHHDDKDQLFDLAEDRDEVHNLAPDPRCAQVLERMRTALAAWMGETGDFVTPSWSD